MENGENPVMRELGQELSAGNIDIDGVRSVPAYADVLRAGMERLATLDVGAMADRLEALLETVETPADVREPAEHEMRDEDYETVVIFDDGR